MVRYILCTILFLKCILKVLICFDSSFEFILTNEFPNTLINPIACFSNAKKCLMADSNTLWEAKLEEGVLQDSCSPHGRSNRSIHYSLFIKPLDVNRKNMVAVADNEMQNKCRCILLWACHACESVALTFTGVQPHLKHSLRFSQRKLLANFLTFLLHYYV